MGKQTARNLTNRTIECQFPGGREFRLRPGERRALAPSDAASPAIRKLQRVGMIEVRSTERKLATQQRAIEKPVQPAPRNTTDKGTSSVAFAAPGTEKATAKHIPSAARKPTEKRGTQAAEKAAAKPKKPQEQAAPAIEAEAPPLEHPEDAAATERPGTRGESEASVEAPAEGERKER